VLEDGMGEPLSLPDESSVTIDDLNDFLDGVLAMNDTAEWDTFSDFLSINWNADGVKWFETVETFMYMLLFARIPEFSPEPSVITDEALCMQPEVPFEKYVYMAAFRHEEVFGDIETYSEFFKNWTDTTPAFEGLEGDIDVIPPNAEGPIALPYHYTKTFVHFLPGGYTNGHTVRVSFTGNTKFNFLKEDIIRKYVLELHGDLQPKRILDIGTGNCFSAMVYAEVYPEAEVIGIDLAAPYIRFCNLWKEMRGISNVHFYQDNAENTHFEDESFDIIQYSYVIHEMPAENAEMLINEAYRLLTPGGVFSGFEVPYIDDFVTRKATIQFQTWGCDWNQTDCQQGPEPYTGEYMDGTRMPYMLEDVGFVDNERRFFSVFDGIFLSYKPS